MTTQTKVSVGIIGTGNIGTDLLYKVLRSPFVSAGLFTGRNKDSEGIRRAQALGVYTSYDSVKAIIDNPALCDIVFDTTTAASHAEHAAILKRLGKFVIDLTPSRLGTMCVPLLNLDQALTSDNVNLVTCGGQTLIPIAKAIMEVHPETSYIEMVGSIASKSAGPGTRANIEEYINTTTSALKAFTGVPAAKAILILNPAEPPILMHNTLYAMIEKPNLELLTKRIKEIEKLMQEFVPGYHVALGPVFDNGKVSVTIEVVGRGDFLPVYAGNLDIITSGALRVAEAYARKKTGVPETVLV